MMIVDDCPLDKPSRIQDYYKRFGKVFEKETGKDSELRWIMESDDFYMSKLKLEFLIENSEVVMLVLNDLRNPDIERIEQIKQIIKRCPQKGEQKILMIIHNWLVVDSEDQLKKKIQEEILEYNDNKIEKTTLRKQKKVQYFYEEDRSIEHYILVKEGTPLGD